MADREPYHGPPLSKAHAAKTSAFKSQYWRLQVGIKDEIGTLNAFLYSQNIISEVTRDKATAEDTLGVVGDRLKLDEKVFKVFISGLEKITGGLDLVKDLNEELSKTDISESPADHALFEYQMSSQVSYPPESACVGSGMSQLPTHSNAAAESPPMMVTGQATPKPKHSIPQPTSHTSDSAMDDVDRMPIEYTQHYRQSASRPVPRHRQSLQFHTRPEQETMPPQAHSAPSTDKEVEMLLHIQQLETDLLSHKHTQYCTVKDDLNTTLDKLNQTRNDLEKTRAQLACSQQDSKRSQSELKRNKKELENTQEKLERTQDKLESTREKLESTREKLETTQDELKKTKDELLRHKIEVEKYKSENRSLKQQVDEYKNLEQLKSLRLNASGSDT